MNKREFLKGLLNTVALPAISLPIVNPYDNISMRLLTNYIPTNVGSIDILYGCLQVKPEWIAKAYKILNNENYYIQSDLS